jgi:hypothetical protein
LKKTILLVLAVVIVSVCVSSIEEAQVFVDENTVIFTACTPLDNETVVKARITIYDDQDNIVMSEQFMEIADVNLYKYTYVFEDEGVYHTRETCQFDSVMVDDGNTFVAAYPAGHSITPTFWQTIAGWFTTLGESIGVLPDPSLLINSTHIYDRPVIVSVPNMTVTSGDAAIITTTLSRDGKLVEDAWCEVYITDLVDNDLEIDFRSAFNNADGTYVYNWSNTGGHEETEDFDVRFDCYGGDALSLRHAIGNGFVTVNI